MRAIVIGLLVMLSGCSDYDYYMCEKTELVGDHESVFIYDHSFVLVHNKNNAIFVGGKNGIKIDDYFYDPETFLGVVSAGRLDNDFHGYIRFWYPTGKLWINLPPRTFLEYICVAFEP